MKLTSQQIELLSKAWLEAQLIKQGFEVARPVYDKGVDLIVFLDEPGARFHAIPVQIKSATEKVFSVHKALVGRGIIMAYIWHVQSDSPKLFLVPHDKAITLEPAIDLTGKSWLQNGKWSESKPSQKRERALRKYQDNFDILQRVVRNQISN